MASQLDADRQLLANSSNVRFRDLVALCERHFGPPRVKGGHHIFKMPWSGDPRANIQKDGKMAKPYQVRAVAKAIEKLRQEGRFDE